MPTRNVGSKMEIHGQKVGMGLYPHSSNFAKYQLTRVHGILILLRRFRASHVAARVSFEVYIQTYKSNIIRVPHSHS